MAKATAPELIAKWFEKHFPEAVDQHDEDYVAQAITRKQADCRFAGAIISRGYFWRGLGAYIYCRSLGWFFWYRRTLWNLF